MATLHMALIRYLFDMGRTCLNVTGDIACSLCVTKWESKKAGK